MFLFVAREYRRGRGASSVSECSRELSAAEEEIEGYADLLTAAGILLTVSESEEGYLPSRPLDSIRMADVITALFGGRAETAGGSEKLEVNDYLDAFLDGGARSPKADASVAEFLESESGGEEQ
jgi:DNA-binding IscR family transcriptional regulator